MGKRVSVPVSTVASCVELEPWRGSPSQGVSIHMGPSSRRVHFLWGTVIS